MCGIFPYFRISEAILYAKESGDGMEIGSPKEGERSYLGSIGREALALFRSTRERDNMVRHSPRTILSTVPHRSRPASLVAVRRGRRRVRLPPAMGPSLGVLGSSPKI